MRRLFKYFLLCVYLFAISPLLAQQQILVTAEKNNIILGEPLKLNIRITGDQVFEANVPDSLGHFEVLKKSPVENSTRNGLVVTSQELLVTCFDSGQFRIPPVAVSGHEGIVSAGFDIMVTPLPADSTKNYGDIKQIIDLKAPAQWPYQAGLAIIAILSAVMAWRLNQQQAKVPAHVPVAIKTESLQTLLQRLLQLKEQWKLQQTSSVDMGNDLMDISKKYFASRGIYAKSKTGEELIVATKSIFDSDTWMGIAQTIRLCNAMRFGKYTALVDEGIQGIEAVEKTLELPAYRRYSQMEQEP